MRRAFQFLGNWKVSGKLMASKANTSLEPTEEDVVGGLASVPGVERILIAVDEHEHAIHVWSIVNNMSDEARHCIYAHEGKLLDRFPHAPFDFHVVDRQDMLIDDLIPGARTVFAK